jgi:hypothetical protein
VLGQIKITDTVASRPRPPLSRRPAVFFFVIGMLVQSISDVFG